MSIVVRMRSLPTAALLGVALGTAACVGDPPAAPSSGVQTDAPAATTSGASAEVVEGSFVVLGSNGASSAELESAVLAAGGALEATLSGIGVVVASSSDADFRVVLEAAQGVRAVLPNLSLAAAPQTTVGFGVELAQFPNPPFSGDDDFFYDMQWGNDAVNAPEAWEAGVRGAGVRLAILDDGIDAQQPDLSPNLNVGLSASFVPGEAFDDVPLFPAFSHGTHIAGIAAAADNAFGIIGVAPEAEIVAIKVLSAQTGEADLAGVIAGMMYAAEVGADVANMSFGFSMSRRGQVFDAAGNEVGTIPARDVAAAWTALSRASQFAYERGVTMVASAGNAATNGNRDADRIHVPSDLPHVISVSATAPRGWALDPFTDLDLPTTYSNTGRSVIDLAAPGGAFDPSLLGQVCTVTFITAVCPAFDLVWSTVGAGFNFAAGTSMAAAHVSGVAALVISENGGSMHPAQVAAALKGSADDLGQPGKDDVYGHGRVNAAAAVGVPES